MKSATNCDKVAAFQVAVDAEPTLMETVAMETDPATADAKVKAEVAVKDEPEPFQPAYSEEGSFQLEQPVGVNLGCNKCRFKPKGCNRCRCNVGCSFGTNYWGVEGWHDGVYESLRGATLRSVVRRGVILQTSYIVRGRGRSISRNNI